MAETFKTNFFTNSRDSEGIGEFQNNHFAEGSVRYAYLGSAKQGGEDSEKMSVLKIFKIVENNTIQNWTCDINSCRCALSFANIFCNLDIWAEKNPHMSLKKLEFVLPKVLKLEGHHHAIPCFMRFCKNNYNFVVIVEPYLEGSYIKFSDNYGFENKSVDADILFAFSHWTYEFSNHECMVSDLQGIAKEDKYVLTDPAVHSIKQVYGLTDLGHTGMQKVLEGHTCNDICNLLKLEQIKRKCLAQHQTQKTRLTNELTKSEKRTNAERRKSYKKRGTSSCQCSRFFKGSSAVYPTSPKIKSKKSTLIFTSKIRSHFDLKIGDRNPAPEMKLTTIIEDTEE